MVELEAGMSVVATLMDGARVVVVAAAAAIRVLAAVAGRRVEVDVASGM